jgi:hypothetical protein
MGFNKNLIIFFPSFHFTTTLCVHCSDRYVRCLVSHIWLKFSGSQPFWKTVAPLRSKTFFNPIHPSRLKIYMWLNNTKNEIIVYQCGFYESNAIINRIVAYIFFFSYIYVQCTYFTYYSSPIFRFERKYMLTADLTSKFTFSQHPFTYLQWRGNITLTENQWA